MDPRLAIALAIHEGACRIIARPQPSRCLPAIAVAESKEAMARIIPDFDDISFDLVYLLDPHARAAAASERLRHLAKDDDTFGWRKTVPTKNMTAAEEIERRGARDEKHS